MIVVGVDGSASAYAAVDWAADDAARRGLDLRVVHVREPWAAEHPLTAASDHHTLTERDAELLNAAARRARERRPGLHVITALSTGSVAERLRHEAQHADALVLGNRGLGGFTGLLLGSVGLTLAGHVPCPLVVVREATPETFGEIVTGFDGSADAEAAVAYALEHARAEGARLRVVYGVRTPTPAPQPVGYGPIPWGVSVQEIGQRLAPWRNKYPDVEMAEEVVAGHPVAVLARASRHADLVVVGSRGLGAFASAVLGSVSHGILHHAHCPVAVVRAGSVPS
ncbi:universal stress protein [Nonomuraea sp. NPDC001684]